ncbi:bifunctional serine/threonine-protein kinase/formylglycine-generating enzyme family protein [Microbulbifer spongiae]|uniref:Bifunctional serine/threonine-protein kinase/formylglycine-generating enzyme family protein n=1 Tax=Microbulbifer spongiae TaxID=2944933 RepID=A0ABY9EJC2_9GAMM|nr:bifunctional serine/threonine-protein kinase/formylglycine-generating enzyme family protein [Microbulbifer sp. MI-G]WKD51321.1 bifunctional serine/threonine-protein kinase/formylglycine-generating enzyme family protein [Microbulbifer sp. MI-G]
MEVVTSGSSSLQIPGYRILKKINQGGMSTVYLAIQRSVGRQVALKVMSPVLNADPVFSERFQREANIVGQLSHPNIVGIHDIGRYRSLNYIAMDFMPGGSVSERLEKGPLAPLEALHVVRQIAMALDHSHSKGYVHRDLKPENILFREDGSAVLSDFGVARAVARTTRMTNSGMVVGTPHYMSPEQARGAAIDGRADLYSLGVVFYEMLTGAVPYQAEEAVAIAIKHLTGPIPRLPSRSAVYQPLIDRFLAKDPDKRFQRGLDVSDAMDQWFSALAGKPSNQVSQLNNASVGIYSLARALLLTLYSSAKERFVFALKRGRTHPEQPQRAQTERDTLVRLHQLLREPAKHKRPWLAGGLMLLSLFLAWSLFSLISAKAQWRSGILLLDSASRLTAGFLSGQADSPLHTPDTAPDKHPAAGVQTAVLGAISGGNHTTAEPVAPAEDGRPPQDPGSGIVKTAAPNPEKVNNDSGTNQARPSESPETPPTYALNVKTSPQDARVRIMNIAPRYQPGIKLEPGKYDLEISRPGFTKVRRWVTLKDSDLTLSLALERTYFAGKKIRSKLPSGGWGPQMIVIEAGGFTMGSNRRSFSSPAHKVVITRAFAISTHEITFDDYDRFALATGSTLPDDAGWGRGDRPVIHVSWEDAQRYVQWLSTETRQRYRLATEAEWEYAARGGVAEPFWWGDDDARGKANCRRGCNSEFNSLFRVTTAPVGHYRANPFGLYDTAGNVAEWVQDCYQPGYDRSRTDATPLLIANCKLHSVRGGSMRDASSKISADYRKGLGDDSRLRDLGFRIVMELE